MKHLKRFLSVLLVAAMLVPSSLPTASAHEKKQDGTQNIHPFYSSEQLIQDAVEELREQGETVEQEAIDKTLVETVEKDSEKTYNEVKTIVLERVEENLDSGKIDVADLNLSKDTLEEVMTEVLSENYMAHAVTDMTYSTTGSKVAEIGFAVSDGFASMLSALNMEQDRIPGAKEVVENLLDKLPVQDNDFMEQLLDRSGAQLFADGTCQRHTVGSGQLLGDVHKDRRLTVKDVAAIHDSMASGEYNEIADLNKDKAVDSKDLDVLRQMIVDEVKPESVGPKQIKFTWGVQHDITPRDQAGNPLDLMNHPEQAAKIANGGLLYVENSETHQYEIKQGILPKIYWGLEELTYTCDVCGEQIKLKRNHENPMDPVNQMLDQMVTDYNIYLVMDPKTGLPEMVDDETPKMERYPVTGPQPDPNDKTKMLFTQVAVASFVDDSFDGQTIDPQTKLPVGMYMDTNSDNNDNMQEMINFYYGMFSKFNADHPELFGVSGRYWTSKTTLEMPPSNVADPLAAIKTLCNIPLGIPMPNTVMAMLVQMLPQAFMAYTMYYAQPLMDMKAQAKSVVDSLPKSATTVEKLLVLHDYVAETATFDMGAMMDLSSSNGNPETDPIQMTPFGALLSDQLIAASQGQGEKMYGGCICLGYAAAYNLLCQEYVYPQYYKHSDGSYKTPDEVGMNDYCDFGQVMFYSNTANSSIAGEGFGGGFFNNVHYYNMVRVPEAPQTGGTKDDPRNGDWFFVDVCYDDIYIECMMQYRAETDGSIHHDFFLASPLSMNKVWGESVDYIDNLHDGVLFIPKMNLKGEMIPFPEGHDQYNPEDETHPAHRTIKAPAELNEVASDNTCYQDTWFSGATSKVWHDGTNWYYVDADNTTFGFMNNIKKDIDGNYYFDFSQMAKHDVKTGIHAVRADITKQPKLNLRPMNAPDYYERTNKDENNQGPREFKLDPHDVDLLDFGTGEGKYIRNNKMLQDAVKEHYTYTDQFPGLSISLNLYNGQLYFNLGNKIYTYDLETNECKVVKTYTTVNAATDGRKYTASSYYIDPKGEAETMFTVENNPIAGFNIRTIIFPNYQPVMGPNGQPVMGPDGKPQMQYMGPIEVPTMTVNIGTNRSFTAAFEGVDTDADMQTLYTEEAHNFNGEYNHVLNRHMNEQYKDNNNNSEFLWCANVRDTIPMAAFQPNSVVPESSSCVAQNSGHTYEYDPEENMYICTKCGIHAQNIVEENEDYDVILHHEPANYRGQGLGANQAPSSIKPVNDVREAAILIGGDVDEKGKVELGDILVEVKPKDGTLSSRVTGVEYESYDGTRHQVTRPNKDGMYVISKPKDFGVMKIRLLTVVEYHVDANFTGGKGTASIDKPIAKPGELVNVTLTPNVGYGIQNITVTTKSEGQTQEVPFERDGDKICFNMPDGSVNVNVKLEKVYKITVNNPKLVSVYPERAAAGTQVFVNPTPGYDLELSVVTPDGQTIQLNEDYSFIMPASDVKVNAAIKTKQASVEADPAQVMNQDEEQVNEDVALNSAADPVNKAEKQDDASEPEA